MTIAVKHKHQSAITDDGSDVGSNAWNDDHDYTMATGKLVGRGTAGAGTFEEITLGTNISLTGTTLNASAGSATPGTPVNSVQFNQPLGTFAGDANLTWVAGAGLTDTIAGVFGNKTTVSVEDATGPITNMHGSPGDPVNEYAFSARDTTVANAFYSGDLSTRSSDGQTTWIGVKHTGVGGAHITGHDCQIFVNSDSTGPWTGIISQVSYNSNYGSGNIDQYTGLVAGVNHEGSGTITSSASVACGVDLGGITGIASGPIITHSAIRVSSPTGTAPILITNNIGVDIKTQAGFGSAQSYNIYSEGATFITPASTTGGNLFVSHTAIGDYADINVQTYAPGDSTNTFSASSLTPLVINNEAVGDIGGIGASYGIDVEVAAKDTGASGGGGSFYGVLANPVIPSDNSVDFFDVVGDAGNSTNYGSGNLIILYGLSYNARHFGTGTVSHLRGMQTGCVASNCGNITTEGAGLSVGILALNATFATTKMIWCQPINNLGGLATTNHYGIFIDSQLGFGSAFSENIRSKGAASINFFEGYVTTAPSLVSALTAPSAYLTGARSFVSDATVTMTAGIGTIVAGTGGNKVPVYCDGTNWRIG